MLINSVTEKKDLIIIHKTAKKALWNLLSIVNTDKKMKLNKYFLSRKDFKINNCIKLTASIIAIKKTMKLYLLTVSSVSIY